MPIRNSHPSIFRAVGLTDAVDQQSTFRGSCESMSNVMFDRQNRGAIIARTGAAVETSFTGFNAPGVVSVAIAVGTRIYGMIATNRNAGKDEPFCYETATSSFITVTGVLNANTPTTPTTTGAWIPPTMDVIGINIVVTHQGFSGGNVIGWFDTTNPAAPAWNAGNTTVNALPSKPIWVAQFFGRAYYGISNNVYFSDSLSALTISNTNFAAVLTLGDTTSSICAAGLPFSTSSAAILQSLVVFKDSSIWQISGDITGSGSNLLALNQMTANLGCSMPRTAVSTPNGIMFIGSDGPRIVDLRGIVDYLSASQNIPSDIIAPFSNATTPSRACASYNNSIYRVCLDTIVSGSTLAGADYWYDNIFRKWTGPHTFPYHGAVPLGQRFFLFSNTAGGKLFSNAVTPSSSSIYTDNGSMYTSSFLTAAMIPEPEMAQCAVVESVIEIGKNTSLTAYTVIAYDDAFNLLDQTSVNYAGATSFWGASTWNGTTWQANSNSSHVVAIPWNRPLVFQKLLLFVSATASASYSVKKIEFRYQQLGYTNR